MADFPILHFCRLKPLDVQFMKAIHNKVNVVPVIAKADTLTLRERERLKRRVSHSDFFPKMDWSYVWFVGYMHFFTGSRFWMKSMSMASRSITSLMRVWWGWRFQRADPDSQGMCFFSSYNLKRQFSQSKNITIYSPSCCFKAMCFKHFPKNTKAP